MPQFDHERASIHYETIGEGKPLLLIAGIASDGASWKPLLPLLPGRQLILIDNRGCGQTKVDGSIVFHEMADDCAALLDHLGLDAVDVLGHSMGGIIGLDLAARHPDRVARLVTLASALGGPSKRVLFHDLSRLYFTVPPADYFRLLFQWLFSDPFFADERNVTAAALASVSYAHRQSPGDFARQVAAIDSTGPMDNSAIRCPVLAVSAELDLVAPPEAVERLHARVPGVRFQTIAGAAHSIHWEKPAEAAAAVNAFLG
ncbi:MAG: alpha/beta fold hydrolase [Devosia sp.]